MTDDELIGFFDALFPQGFTGPDVLAEIAPEGWIHSPLLSCFHPSPERVLEERLSVYHKLEDMSKRRAKNNSNHSEQNPKPTIEDVLADWKDKPIETDNEIAELIALCLWDIFSDNHEVVAQDGRVVDIGSFRGAAAFLDGYLNRSKESDNIWDADYLRFYLGTIWIGGRADLMPVYELIFKRLKSLKAVWVYHFPQLNIIDLRSYRKTTKDGDFTDYSPSEAFAAESKEIERQKQLNELRADLSDVNLRARHRAMDLPPPLTVQAYEHIFKESPKGWPPL